MDGTRSNQTFIESLGVATGTCEEDGQEDKVGHRPERAEQADSQGQIPSHEYTGDLAQPAKCYSVFIVRCFRSLSQSENQTWEQTLHIIYQCLQHILIHKNPE